MDELDGTRIRSAAHGPRSGLVGAPLVWRDELADGTVLVDTPGVRQFGLAGLDARTLAGSFPELAGPARRCRFRDCSHLVEPDCGVQVALAAGAIDPRRFASYGRLRAALEQA